jgi:hypothetical protein
MTQGREANSLAPGGARRLTGIARRLSVVAAMFVIVALVALTASTSRAKGLKDTVTVSNAGALFSGSIVQFTAGTGNHGHLAPKFVIRGSNTLLGASGGPTLDAVGSLDHHVAVAVPIDFFGLSAAAFGAPVGCGPFGLPATGPLFGTGFVEIFSPTATGNSAPENAICSPDFAIGEDGAGLAPGFPNTTGIFYPQGVAYESPFDGITPSGHQILAVANLFPVVLGPDSPLAACAPTPPSTTPGTSLGTITEYDTTTFAPGLNNVPPINNSPVLALNPLPTGGIPPVPPPGVIYEQNATIGGCLSLLAGPIGLSFDQFGFLFVVNNAGRLSAAQAAAPRFVTVYHPGAFGDSFPNAAIGVPGTDTAGAFSQPISVAVVTGPLPLTCTGAPGTPGCFPDDVIFVTDLGDNSIKIYSPFTDFSFSTFFFQGTLLGTIHGGATKLKAPEGIAISADNDTLYVVNNTADSLSEFTDITSIESGGNVPPTLIVQNRHAKMNLPVGVALGAFTPSPTPTSTESLLGAE